MKTLLYIQLLVAVSLASSNFTREENSHPVEFYEITEDGDEIVRIF